MEEDNGGAMFTEDFEIKEIRRSIAEDGTKITRVIKLTKQVIRDVN